jgi:hypothetical protein
MKDMFFSVKLAQQNLSIYYAEATSTTDISLITAHILDPFRKLQTIFILDKAMAINPKDETSYTTQSREAFRKYVDNEYCAKK